MAQITATTVIQNIFKGKHFKDMVIKVALKFEKILVRKLFELLLLYGVQVTEMGLMVRNTFMAAVDNI